MRTSPDYHLGVSDSLKMLFHYITGLEHATGFRASATAQNHAEMLKGLYNQMHMTLVNK